MRAIVLICLFCDKFLPFHRKFGGMQMNFGAKLSKTDIGWFWKRINYVSISQYVYNIRWKFVLTFENFDLQLIKKSEY